MCLGCESGDETEDLKGEFGGRCLGLEQSSYLKLQNRGYEVDGVAGDSTVLSHCSQDHHIRLLPLGSPRHGKNISPNYPSYHLTFAPPR